MPRKNRNVNAEGQIKEQKPDLRRNYHFLNDRLISPSDRGKMPLKITEKLTILVSPDKCNQEYASEYRERLEKHRALSWS